MSSRAFVVSTQQFTDKVRRGRRYDIAYVVYYIAVKK